MRRQPLRRLACGAVLACSLAAPLAQTVDPIRQAMPDSILASRLPIGSDGDGWRVRAFASDFEAVDAVPVRGLSGDWSRYTPRAGRNQALQSARAELAASRGTWELAAIARADFRITGPRSSWDAVRAYRHRDTPADGSRFGIDAHQQGVITTGLRAAHTWTLGPDLLVTAAASALSVRRMQRIDLAGRIDYSRVDGYAFDIVGQRQDSAKHFGGYGREGTTGSGWSTDLGLLWRPTADSFVNLSAVDLLSRLRVGAVSTQQATLSSATTSLDGRGFLAYQPLVSGRYSSAQVDTRLDRQWVVSAGTQFGSADRRLLAGARFERNGDVTLPALWAALPVASGLTARIDAELRFRSLGLGLATRWGSVMLRSRSLPVGGSRAIGWQAGLQVPL